MDADDIAPGPGNGPFVPGPGNGPLAALAGPLLTVPGPRTGRSVR